MDGSEKLPLLVIGKSRNPRCMKNCHSLPVLYESNSKAWMTTAIFEKWLLELDEKFGEQKRHVILFIDNCPAHPKNIQDRLDFIKLEYFPPNTTSVLQPLDLGVIKNLKHYYRNNLVRKRLQELEEEKVSI